MCIRDSYRVLDRLGKFTYIEAQLETGRTHQIRVHMTYAGHPLLGDSVYAVSYTHLDVYKRQGTAWLNVLTVRMTL